MAVSPADSYVVVTVNGVTGLYRYRSDGKRDQPLQFVASVADLVDIWRISQEE